MRQKLCKESMIFEIDAVSVLYVLFVLVDIGTFMFRAPYLLRNAALLCVGAVSIIYCLAKGGVSQNKPFIVFVVLYTACGYFSFVVNHNADIQELLWPVAFMGFGLLLLNFKMPYPTAVIVFWAVSAIFIAAIVLHGGVDNLALRSSRNTISVYELEYWTIYMIAAYEEKKDVKPWSVLMGLLVCVLSIGRGGMLTFAVIIVMLILLRPKAEETDSTSKESKAAYAVLYVFLLIAAVAVAYRVYGTYIDQMIDNFRQRGIESKRPLIWREYFENVKRSLWYVFFGAPQRGGFWLDRYAENLHNSLLELHAKYGLFMVITIVGVLIMRCIQFIKEKNMYLLIPLVGWVIRMNLDYTNFNSLLDVVFIFFFLYPQYRDVLECERIAEE